MSEIDPQKIVDDWQEGMKQLIAKRAESLSQHEAERPRAAPVLKITVDGVDVSPASFISMFGNSITPSEITL